MAEGSDRFLDALRSQGQLCDDCIYPQAKVAKNFGATREEIMEALSIAVLTGGVPTWSNAKHGI